MIRSLRGRVFAATLTASLLAVGVALAIGVVTTRSAVRDSYRQEALREARVVAQNIALRGNAGAPSDTLPALPQAQSRAPGGARLTAPSGARDSGGATGPSDAVPPDAPGGGPQGRLDSPRPLVLTLDDAAALLGTQDQRLLARGRAVSGRATIDGHNTLFAAAPVPGTRSFVLARRPYAVDAGDFGSYLTGLIVAALAAAALSAVAAAGLAGRITSPISEVVTAAGQLASGRHPEHIKVPETTELAELATSFNEMSDNLARAREAERTVLMSASHELRTPLTAISGYAEGIEDGTIDARAGTRVILSESQRLERLVQDLLVLARLDQGTFETHAAPVDLAQIAGSARDRLALRAGEEHVALHTDCAAGSHAFADADRVLQIITNLVDNALRVTPQGGSVTIVTRPGAVVVSDTGPGIPTVDLPHVFERFHMRRRRGMGSPDGSGIGLAIVRELAQAMGGSVSVASVEGAGASFTVTLPQSPVVRTAPGPAAS